MMNLINGWWQNRVSGVYMVAVGETHGKIANHQTTTV